MSVRQLFGLAAAGCIACCIGPILGVLSAVAALGIISTLWSGIIGIAIAAMALGNLFIARLRRRSWAIPHSETPVTLTTRS